MESRFPYHLCQPDESKSCAACCGIYNFRRNGREDVSERLKRNTEFMKAASRGGLQPESLVTYSEKVRDFYNGESKLFVTVFNCEFAGFLDDGGKRVGCLLHPSRNGGRDWRDFSFYGAELCDGHYCLSYFYLTPSEQRLVIESTDDWYLYGLTITDIDLVKGVYNVLSNEVGEAINPDLVSQSRELRQILNSIWSMKLSWKYRIEEEDSFGKYLFRGEEYREIKIPYELFNRKPSPYHSIFLSFGSAFKDGQELEEAEMMLKEKFGLFAGVYSEVRLKSKGCEPVRKN